MSHQTRNGKLFNARWCGDVQQTSRWSTDFEAIHQILSSYITAEELAAAKSVCQAWDLIARTHLEHLHLPAPATINAARALGLRVARRYPNVSRLHLQLHISLAHFRMPAEKAEKALATIYIDVEDEQLQLQQMNGETRAGAVAVALLQAISRGRGPLLHLELDIHNFGVKLCTMLPSLLPLMPQLVSLDLSGCLHQSSDLLVIAQQLKQLQQLRLNAPKYTTLEGKQVEKGMIDFPVGSAYQPDHLAALTELTGLQLLEVPLPSLYKDTMLECVAALAQLTQLSALQIVSADWKPTGWVQKPLPVEAVSSLSSLRSLTHLKCAAGSCSGHVIVQQQVQHWCKALAGMPLLQQLSLYEVCLNDELLQLIGSKQPALKKAAFAITYNSKPVSQAGAQAVAAINSIELHWGKCFRCDDFLPLLQLPSVQEYFISFHAWRFRHSAMPPRPRRWVQDRCACDFCLRESMAAA